MDRAPCPCAGGRGAGDSGESCLRLQKVARHQQLRALVHRLAALEGAQRVDQRTVHVGVRHAHLVQHHEAQGLDVLLGRRRLERVVAVGARALGGAQQLVQGAGAAAELRRRGGGGGGDGHRALVSAPHDIRVGANDADHEGLACGARGW